MESAQRGHRQRRRHARPALPQGRAACGNRPGGRRIPAEPVQVAATRQRVAGAAGRRPQGFVHSRRQPGAGPAIGKWPTGGLLPVPDLRRHRTDFAHARRAHHQRRCVAARPVPADQRDQAGLQRLLRQPGASLLPDVAATGLQCLSRHTQATVGLRLQAVLVGRGHGRRGRQWARTTGQFQRRVFINRTDHR